MSVNQENIDASVVIPAYNCSNTIGELLEALHHQDFEGNFEVIIADNRCTDNTLSIVNQYTNRIKHLRIINAHKNKGAGYARNRGVEEAESNRILFCDADDKVSDNWVEQMVKALEKHEIVAPKMEHFALSQPRYAKIRKHMQVDGLLTSKFKPSWPFAGASGLGIRKELHESINGFDENLLASEDIDYCWRAQLEENAELVFNPNTLIHIRHRGKPLQFIKQALYWGSFDPVIVKKYKKYGLAPPDFKEIKLKYKRKIVNLNKITDQVWRDHLTWCIFHDLGKLKGYLMIKFNRS